MVVGGGGGKATCVRWMPVARFVDGLPLMVSIAEEYDAHAGDLGAYVRLVRSAFKALSRL